MSAILEEQILEDGQWKPPPSQRRSLLMHSRRRVIDFLITIFGLREKIYRKELSKTAYLDGLRGFAAFIVYLQHHNLWVHLGGHELENAFGYEGKRYFSTLPIIRLFFTGGHLAVTTFFVISGYALSLKPLQLIHAGNHEKLLENVSSALFRRWLRLYIPVIVTTFLYFTSWHVFDLWTENQQREKSYKGEIWKWYCDIKNFSFIFNSGESPWLSYNGHLWSIPVELKGSIMIYVALLALSRCRRNARLWCQAGLIFYFMYIVDGSFFAMFMAGMLLCDLDLLAHSNNLPLPFQRFRHINAAVLYHLLVLALYLGGVPADNNKTATLKKSYGWFLLSYLKPQAVFDYKWFYLFWASTMLVFCTSRIFWLRSFFENRFNQYLGRISFALYLVHGPILNVLGDRLYVAVGWINDSNQEGLSGWVNLMPLPRVGPMGLELSLILPQVILLPVTLWTADAVTRLVDTPSVNFAKWLYGKTLAPPNLLKL